MSSNTFKHNERGAALIEFALAATIFLTAIFAVLEFGRMLWIRNALVDATRRGARYAVNHNKGSLSDIKEMAVFGNSDGTGTSLINGLTPDHIIVTYSGNWTVGGGGTVTVEIQNYDFQFVLPFVGTSFRMADCHTTLPGENVGLVPNDI